MSVEFMINSSRTLFHEMRTDVFGPRLSRAFDKGSKQDDELRFQLLAFLAMHAEQSRMGWFGWWSYTVSDEDAEVVRQMVGLEEV